MSQPLREIHQPGTLIQSGDRAFVVQDDGRWKKVTGKKGKGGPNFTPKKKKKR